MRWVTMLVLTSVVVATMATPASAWSFTGRSDPNDTPTRPDLRKIWTDASATHVLLKIGTWDRLRARDAAFVVLLDTRKSLAFDRIIEISGGQCVVEKIENGSLGAFVGRREARRPSGRVLKCHRMPASWFAITKTVGFLVRTGYLGSTHPDSAPDDGRFVGL